MYGHDQNLLVDKIMKANRYAFPEAFAEYEKNHAKVLNRDVIDEIAKATNRNDDIEALLILAAAVRAEYIASELTKIREKQQKAGRLENHLKAERYFYYEKLIQLTKEKFDNFDEIYQAL